MVLSSTKTGTLLYKSSSQTVEVIQKVKYKISTKDIMVRFVNIDKNVQTNHMYKYKKHTQ